MYPSSWFIISLIFLHFSNCENNNGNCCVITQCSRDKLELGGQLMSLALELQNSIKRENCGVSSETIKPEATTTINPETTTTINPETTTTINPETTTTTATSSTIKPETTTIVQRLWGIKITDLGRVTGTEQSRNYAVPQGGCFNIPVQDESFSRYGVRAGDCFHLFTQANCTGEFHQTTLSYNPAEILPNSVSGIFMSIATCNAQGDN